MMRRRAPATGCVVAILAAAGCGGAGAADDGTATIRRDSAGVRIVQNVAPARGDRSPWRVDTTPTFALASTSADERATFQHVLTVLRLSDGTVVVLDAGPPFVRAFAPDGSPRWSAIRRGDGPGEIRDAAMLGRIRGDSLVVDDARTPRSVLLAADGRVHGTWEQRLVAPGDSGARRPVQPAVRLDDGSVVAYAPTLSRAELAGSGIAVPRWRTYVVGRDGSVAGDVGALPFVTTGQLDAPAVHVVFGARAALAPLPGGGFAYGFPTTAEVQLRDRTGRLTTIVRTPGDRRVATAEEERRGRLLAAAATARPDRVAEIADRLLVDTLPAYGRVVVGTDGVLWRERFDPAAPPGAAGRARLDAPSTWDVHDASGAWLGAVALPAAFHLTDAGASWVAGIHVDADDVQSPRVYPLVKEGDE